MIYILFLSAFLSSQAVYAQQCIAKVTGSPFALAGGAAPRGVSFSPEANSNLFLALSSLAGSPVNVFQVNTVTGVPTAVAGSPFASDGNAHGIAYSPLLSGNLFLSVPNFGSDNITVFSANTATGALSAIVGSPFANGSSPRSFNYSPVISGNLFAMSTAGFSSVRSFVVNTSTGALTTASTVGAGDLPVSVAISPDLGGTLFAAAANQLSNDVSVYSVNTTTGVLTGVTGSPFVVGANPYCVAFSPLVSGGLFAAVSMSGGVVIYSVNTATGFFTPVSGQGFGDEALSVAYSDVVNGKLYAAVTTSAPNLHVYSVDLNNGSFTEIGGSPLSTANIPFGVDISALVSYQLFIATANSTGSTDVAVMSFPPLLSTVQQNSCASSLLTVTGMAQPGVSLNIRSDGQLIGSGVSDNGGNFSIASTTEISTGVHAITIEQTTGLCSGSSSNSININIAQGPVLASAVQQNSCVSSLITVTGTAESNATLQILADGQVIGSGTCDNAGNFSFSSNTEIEAGTYAITVMQISGSCVGSSSNSITITIGIGPVLLSAVEQSCTNLLILVSGTAEANVTLEILAHGQVIGSGACDNAGNYSFSSTVPVAPGNHAITVRQTSGTCTGTSSNSILIAIRICLPRGGALVEAIRNKCCPFIVIS